MLLLAHLLPGECISKPCSREADSLYSVFHFVLGLGSAHVCFKSWIKHRPRCPTCHQPVNSFNPDPIYVSIRTGGHDEECPKYNIAMSVNESQSDEGDMLITPSDDQ